MFIILLITSEKQITLDVNLQFAIFSDHIAKPVVYQYITMGFGAKNCKLQIANCKFTCPNTSY